jgi:hypothetical protein
MRRLRRYLFEGFSGWIAAIAILCATTLVVAACVSGGNTTGFPTGRSVREEPSFYAFEFDKDGTWRFFAYDGAVPTASGKYATSGNPYTEMTHDTSSPKIPVTYFWEYDGKNLTFRLWGEDVIPARKSAYDGQTYTKAE